MLRFVGLKNKLRITAKDYDADGIHRHGLQKTMQIGVMMPSDMVVLDVDCDDVRSKCYIDWLIKKYPDVLITKTLKAGGYHVYFKTNKRIKQQIHVMSVFGFYMDIKCGTKTYVTLPDNYQGREYYNGWAKSFDDLSDGWDEYKVMLPQEFDSVCPYVDAEPNHTSPLALIDGERNAGLLEWLGYFVAKGVSVDSIKEYTDVFAGITGLDTYEINNTLLSSLDRYSNKENVYTRAQNKAYVIPDIYGEDEVDVCMQLVDFIKETKIAGYDSATGLGYFIDPFGRRYEKLPMNSMKEKFKLYVASKLHIKKIGRDNRVTIHNVPASVIDPLFNEVLILISYNSRDELYANIPMWDGTKRLDTFMKKYFECDVNPNFFLLFMTSIVGKMHDPKKAYVPYFFDFVGEMEIGKSSLLKRLSKGFCTFVEVGGRPDDMFERAYTTNALLYVDDECAMTDPDEGRAINKEKWKQMVTSDTDSFSKKYQNTETRDRGFIFCRTSNKIKTATTIGERRQIIFESRLPRLECRIVGLPDMVFDQLLAEAKVWYERHGVYKLTEKDKEYMRLQQAKYFDNNTSAYIQIKRYIEWARTKATSGYMDEKWRNCLIVDSKLPTGFGVNWKTYARWCEEGNFKDFSSKTFWATIAAISARTGLCSSQSVDQMTVDGEPEYYSVLYVKDEDVRIVDYTIDYDERVVEPVLDFFNTDTSVCSNNDIEKELGAIGVATVDIKNTYDVHKFIGYCPASVKEFFNFYKNSAELLTPTDIDVGGMIMRYGSGGVHYSQKDISMDNVVHLDVKSMYPNLMVAYGLLSRGITKPDVYKQWLADRLKAKESGDTELDKKLKFKINKVYGLTRSKGSKLYDPHRGNTVAVLGQILMTILIVGLKNKGFNILNVNTDGIIFSPKGAFDYKPMVAEWERRTGLTLKETRYKHIEIIDVNNMQIVLEDGTIINKGAKFIS